MTRDHRDDDVTSGAGDRRLHHEIALETDLRDHFEQGEQIKVSIEKSPRQNGGKTAVARVWRGEEVNDAVIFVYPTNCQLEPQDRVQCRIINVSEDKLHGQAIVRLH